MASEQRHRRRTYQLDDSRDQELETELHRNVLTLDDTVPEERSGAECSVDGCTREGVSVRKLRASDRVAAHTVCRRHQILFYAIRLLVIGLLVSLVLLLFFR